jgi:hypothetical protein
MPARMARTARVYLDLARHDSGWGLAPDQVSSLVNTAEVLAILQAGGVPFAHSGVQNALTYLTKHLKPHLDDPDHGPRTRYVTFTILGLTEYAHAYSRADVRDCLSFAYKWLAASNRVAGGWSAQADSDKLSLFATCSAVGALARSSYAGDATSEGVECLLEHSLSGQTWPTEYNPSEKPIISPALTGLAALALFEAGHDKLADRGIKWLLKHPEWWQNRTEDARNEIGTSWRHMSFSICARAVLRAGTPIFDARLRPTLKYVGSLWSQRDGLWSDGAPDGHLTVRGAYAAAQLYQELRRGLGELDALALAERLNPEETDDIDATSLGELTLNDGTTTIEITSAFGSRHTVPLDQRLYVIVKTLHLADGTPVSTQTLAKELAIRAPDVAKHISQLVVTVHNHTNGAIGKLIISRDGGHRLNFQNRRG